MKSHKQMTIEEQAAWSMGILRSGRPITPVMAQKLRGDDKFWQQAHLQMNTEAFIEAVDICLANCAEPLKGTYERALIDKYVPQLIARLRKAEKGVKR